MTDLMVNIFIESSLEVTSYDLFLFPQHIPNSSVILFQMTGHNPTGADPTVDQWKEMSRILKDRNILVFFDMAYQGFSSGSFETDAFPVRHFIEEGHRVVLAQSYSKNMGIYSVRVGAATFLVDDEEDKKSILNELRYSAKVMYGQVCSQLC